MAGAQPRVQRHMPTDNVYNHVARDTFPLLSWGQSNSSGQGSFPASGVRAGFFRQGDLSITSTLAGLGTRLMAIVRKEGYSRWVLQRRKEGRTP